MRRDDDGFIRSLFCSIDHLFPSLLEVNHLSVSLCKFLHEQNMHLIVFVIAFLTRPSNSSISNICMSLVCCSHILTDLIDGTF